MKTKLLAIALAAACIAPAQAQYTGDPALDAVLATLDALYYDEPDYYVEQIVYETRAQPVIVREYIHERRYAPADVYLIGELAQLSGKSFADVAGRYEANRGQGWGAVARDLGIKPGSAQFHALKDGGALIVERGKSRGRSAAAPGHAGKPARVVKTAGKGPGKGQGQGKGRGKGEGKDKPAG